jgi:signal transduction histidine kinase
MLLLRRLPIERPRLLSSLLAHLLASIGFSLAYVALRSALAVWQAPDAVAFPAAFRALLVKSWHFNIVVYWVIGAVAQAFNYYEKFRDRELRASELERRLTESRLQALQMQLNPHFLFNTLHAISALMHKDVDAADSMLVRLSELLRHALEATDIQEVTLREELNFLSRYLDIERTRFGERLDVQMKIAPETLDQLVPNLMLQPVLENAIRHGIEPHARQGRIEVETRSVGETLCISVRDNGGGLPDGPLVEGVGLSNTRARMEQLYPRRHKFELRNAPGGGVEVVIELPCRTTSIDNAPASGHQSRQRSNENPRPYRG